MSSRKTKAVVALIVAPIGWGTFSIAARYLGEYGLNAYSINFFSFLVGSIVVACLAKKRKINLDIKRNIKNPALLLQGLFFALTVILFTFALLNTTVANANFLHKTMPVWVAVSAAVVFNEKITVRKITALVLAVLGIMMLFDVNLAAANFRGDILALLASFAFAAMTLNGRRLKNVNELVSSFYQIFIGLLFLLIPFFYTVIELDVTSPLRIIALVVYVGVVPTALMQRLYLYGLRYIEASTASMFTLLESVSATLLAYLLLNERLSSTALFGITLIIIATIVALNSLKKQVHSSNST